MPTLSILVPHYNDPTGFLLSLKSVEAQTWKGKREIVVVDDGSITKHRKTLQQIVEGSDETIRLIDNKENRGRPYTRNVLLDAAEGKYSTWLDAGDELYPNKIRDQIGALHRTRLLGIDRPVWCTSNFDWQWEGAQKRLRKQRIDGDQINNMLVGSLGAYLWTTLATTRAYRDVGYFDLNLPRLQDLDFFLRFLSKDGMVILPHTHEPLCVYHKSDKGRRGQQVLECYQYVHKKHSALLMQRSRRYRRNRRFDVYMHAARFTLNNNELLQMAKYLGISAVMNPAGFVKRLIKNKGKL